MELGATDLGSRDGRSSTCTSFPRLMNDVLRLRIVSVWASIMSAQARPSAKVSSTTVETAGEVAIGNKVNVIGVALACAAALGGGLEMDVREQMGSEAKGMSAFLSQKAGWHPKVATVTVTVT